MCNSWKRGWPYLSVLLICVLFLLTSHAHVVQGQTPIDPTTLSYEAFSHLQQIYRSGGQAPDLLARLNVAIGMIQDARIKRTQGDILGGKSLEVQATSAIQSVLNAAPESQQAASQGATVRTVVTLATIPVGVVASTAFFYVILRTWRYYERMKLYEMRISEGQTKDQPP